MSSSEMTDEIPHPTPIARELARRAIDVCRELLPNGKERKNEWCVGSLNGTAGDSLKVRLTGAKAGVWKDFGGGAGDSGDLIGLWKAVRGLSVEDASIAALEWLNLPPAQRAELVSMRVASPRPKRIETRPPSESWLRVQRTMKPGGVAELSALANVRKLPSLAGLELATRAGHLWFSELRDDDFWCPCWILTDGRRHNAQARKLDGSLFTSIGDKKSKTLPGCEATWPVGISEVGDKPDIYLVEGGPDFLAAWHLIWLIGKTAECAPCAMFGVANPIHGAALPMFRGKNVRIFPHNDANLAGMNGAIRWRSELLEAGARAVDFFDFRPEGNKDLNDFVTQYGIPELKEVV